MISLENYGFDNFFKPQQTQTENLLTGRIISVLGFKYYVITENGELETELSGKLMFGASLEELPKLGDWVTLMDYGSMGYIIGVMPRKNELSRKSPGAKMQRQILAVNIDHALIVQGLDQNFNIMRLERYLVQLAACAIKPIVILNKSDLISDQNEYRAAVERLQRDCPVYFCSTYTGMGMEELKNEILRPKKTYILIGSSGVGKSSLLNALMDHTVQLTDETSVSNHKGKHTTTTRDLFQLPNGSLLIDTPGMREFGLTFEEGETDVLFPAIDKFASSCRFSDCKHTLEAGCAVLEALNTGALDAEVYESYLKLIREQRRFEVNTEDKKRMNKQAGKISREASNHRKKFKF